MGKYYKKFIRKMINIPVLITVLSMPVFANDIDQVVINFAEENYGISLHKDEIQSFVNQLNEEEYLTLIETLNVNDDDLSKLESGNGWRD